MVAQQKKDDLEFGQLGFDEGEKTIISDVANVPPEERDRVPGQEYRIYRRRGETPDGDRRGSEDETCRCIFGLQLDVKLKRRHPWTHAI